MRKFRFGGLKTCQAKNCTCVKTYCSCRGYKTIDGKHVQIASIHCCIHRRGCHKMCG